jgi:ferredoxin/flavodoxin
MKKALVLYYTCSNNTQKIAEVTGEILMNLNWETKVLDLCSYSQTKDSINPDLLILGVPVQYWEMPDAALSLIQRLPQFNNTAGFVFSTFGKCVCNTVPYHLARELQAKGVQMLGGGQIAMPHSARLDANTRIGDVETRFGKGEPTTENREKYKSVVQTIAKKVENGNVDEIDINELKKLHTRGAFASILNLIMTADKRRNPLPFVQHDSEKCKQCYQCIDNCDNQAIKLSEDKVIVKDKNLCRKCYKCVEVCSEKAMYLDWEKVIYWVRFVRRFSKNNDTVLVA